MSILTPSCHMENYSPEDHRHDLRPVFYPLDFTWQFRKINELVSFIVNDNSNLKLYPKLVTSIKHFRLISTKVKWINSAQQALNTIDRFKVFNYVDRNRTI